MTGWHELKVHTGFRKFTKVMEIDDAIFQGMGSFGKELFQNGYRKVLGLYLEKFLNNVS